VTLLAFSISFSIAQRVTASTVIIQLPKESRRVQKQIMSPEGLGVKVNLELKAVTTQQHGKPTQQKKKNK
jgi:hypothetical protein